MRLPPALMHLYRAPKATFSRVQYVAGEYRCSDKNEVIFKHDRHGKCILDRIPTCVVCKKDFR